jgi:hypothetical protein
VGDLFAGDGTSLLERLELPSPYLARVGSLRRLIEELDAEIDLFARLVRGGPPTVGRVTDGSAHGHRGRPQFVVLRRWSPPVRSDLFGCSIDRRTRANRRAGVRCGPTGTKAPNLAMPISDPDTGMHTGF